VGPIHRFMPFWKFVNGLGIENAKILKVETFDLLWILKNHEKVKGWSKEQVIEDTREHHQSFLTAPIPITMSSEGILAAFVILADLFGAILSTLPVAWPTDVSDCYADTVQEMRMFQDALPFEETMLRLGRSLIGAQLATNQVVFTNVVNKLRMLIKAWEKKDQGCKALISAFSRLEIQPHREIRKLLEEYSRE
jgi:hypothetical protein